MGEEVLETVGVGVGGGAEVDVAQKHGRERW